MKRNLLIGMFFLCLVLPATVFPADDIPIENSKLSIDGGNINVNFDIVGMAGKSKEIKTMFVNSFPLTEITTIQPSSDWYFDTQKNETTLKEMYAEGWTIQHVIPGPTLKQFYLIMTR